MPAPTIARASTTTSTPAPSLNFDTIIAEAATPIAEDAAANSTAAAAAEHLSASALAGILLEKLPAWQKGLAAAALVAAILRLVKYEKDAARLSLQMSEVVAKALATLDAANAEAKVGRAEAEAALVGRCRLTPGFRS